jgi:hypothetical protein
MISHLKNCSVFYGYSSAHILRNAIAAKQTTIKQEDIPMKKLIQIVGLAGLLLISSFETIHAQNYVSPINKDYYWLNFGLGAGSIGEEGGIAINANLSYQFDSNLLSLRTVGNGELFGKSMTDYGVLYGRSLSQNSLFVSVGAGLAMVEGSISHGLFSDEEPEAIGPVLGIPLEVQLFWRPLSFLGIGIYGFANINQEESFTGATLNLQLGKLR